MRRNCVICGKEFESDNFHPNSKCCSPNCRNKLWVKLHPERTRELARIRTRKYRERHPEVTKAYTKRLVESGRASINQKVWAENNPEKIRKIRLRTYWKNHEYRLANSRKHKYLRRAIESKTKIKFGKEEQNFVKQRDNYTCLYCNENLRDKILEFDHIIPIKNKGTNSLFNIGVSCNKCNRKKSVKSVDKFLYSRYCKERGITKDTINQKIIYMVNFQKKKNKFDII
jgi:5-methylcytosine-specific restriction endonuclease McrA